MTTTHRLIELASLSPDTEKLWHALPRGVRITRQRMLAVAATLGCTETGATLRMSTLRRTGFVEEFFVRDGTGQTEKAEWMVIE